MPGVTNCFDGRAWRDGFMHPLAIAQSHALIYHDGVAHRVHHPALEATQRANHHWNHQLGSAGATHLTSVHALPTIRPFSTPPLRRETLRPAAEIEADSSGDTTSDKVYFFGSGIDASDDLWYFEGETPAYYG